MEMSLPLTLTLSPEGRGDVWGGRGALCLTCRPWLAAGASGGDISAKMKVGAGRCG